jgi:metal-responsive CopG/Arc/MetJ family transcriptional regulator
MTTDKRFKHIVLDKLINLKMPSELVKHIDAICKVQQMSRSRFIRMSAAQNASHYDENGEGLE